MMEEQGMQEGGGMYSAEKQMIMQAQQLIFQALQILVQVCPPEDMEAPEEMPVEEEMPVGEEVPEEVTPA
jgi:hypothetical protein